MPSQNIRLDLELSSAVVTRPGDKLVIGIRDNLTDAEAEELRARAAVLPPGVEAVVLSGVSGLVVYQRPLADRIAYEGHTPLGAFDIMQNEQDPESAS